MEGRGPRRRRRQLQRPSRRRDLPDRDHELPRTAGATGHGAPQRVRLVLGQLRASERRPDRQLQREHHVHAREPVERDGQQLPGGRVPQARVRGDRLGRTGLVRRRRHHRREGDSELLLRRRGGRCLGRMVRARRSLHAPCSRIRVLLVQRLRLQQAVRRA